MLFRSRLLEMPIRRGTYSYRRVLKVVVASTAVVAVAVWSVAPAPAVVALDDTALPSNFGTVGKAPPSTGDRSLVSTTSPATTSPAIISPATTSPGLQPKRPRRVLLLGDSTMVGLAKGVFNWAAQHPSEVKVASVARVGCGVMRSSRMVGDGDGRFDFRCEHLWNDELPASLVSGTPDTALIMVTVPDASARVWDPGEGPLQPSDPRFVSRLAGDYERLYQQLRAVGIPHIVWVVPPLPSHKWMGWLSTTVTPADWTPMIDEITNLGQQHPGDVEVLRFDTWLAAHEPRDGVWRYDGLHFDEASATAMVEQYLGAELLKGPWGQR